MNDPSVSDVRHRTDKPLDAWWTVLVVDPIAVRAVWFVHRFLPWVTPGLLTGISFVFGVVAAVGFAFERNIVAVLFYQAGFLFDCMDGRLARLQRRTSELGALLDGLTNHLVYVFALLGIVYGNYGDRELTVLCFLLLCLRVASIHLNSYLRREVAGTHSHFVTAQGSWLARHRLLPPGAFPDKHAVLFLAAPVLGWWLPCFGAVAILEAAMVVLKFRKAVRETGMAPPPAE